MFLYIITRKKSHLKWAFEIRKGVKPEHRYENTIELINMNIEKKNRIKNEKLINEQNRRYELCKK